MSWADEDENLSSTSLQIGTEYLVDAMIDHDCLSDCSMIVTYF